MQSNQFCYSYNSLHRQSQKIQLQPDCLNGGFLPNPPGTSYVNPEEIDISEHETLILDGDDWKKVPFYVGTKLYHKSDQLVIEITEIGKSPEDYPDYTIISTPQCPDEHRMFYKFSDSQAWEFNLQEYKQYRLKDIKRRCVSENYAILPQHKRDNIYSGSPASDHYPPHLQGERGKDSIAKLNSIYQQIAQSAKENIFDESIKTPKEVDNIYANINFPSEEEILKQINK